MAQDFFVFDRTFVSKNHSRIRMNEEGGAREGEGEGEGGGGGGGGGGREGRIRRRVTCAISDRAPRTTCGPTPEDGPLVKNFRARDRDSNCFAP